MCCVFLTKNSNRHEARMRVGRDAQSWSATIISISPRLAAAMRITRRVIFPSLSMIERRPILLAIHRLVAKELAMRRKARIIPVLPNTSTSLGGSLSGTSVGVNRKIVSGPIGTVYLESESLQFHTLVHQLRWIRSRQLQFHKNVRTILPPRLTGALMSV